MSLWKFCHSLKLAILLASSATFLLMGGSLFFAANPQLYGSLDQMPLAQWFHRVAAANPWQTWWFYAFALAIFLLFINTACCFIDWLQNIRSRWRKSGEYLIHLGVLLLLTGYLWGAVGGWRHLALPCTVGALTPLTGWPGHYLAVDSFHPVFDASGRPTDMISQIRLLSGDHQILAGEVRINQPLLSNGLIITPASFGRRAVGFLFSVAGHRYALSVGDRIQLKGGGQLEILNFLPDAREENGQAILRRERLNSPAIKVLLTWPTEQNWRGWYFLRHSPPAALRPLRLRPLQPIYSSYSSLTINYDPGIQIVASGGILVAAGCFLSLFSFYRKRKHFDRPEI